MYVEQPQVCYQIVSIWHPDLFFDILHSCFFLRPLNILFLLLLHILFIPILFLLLLLLYEEVGSIYVGSLPNPVQLLHGGVEQVHDGAGGSGRVLGGLGRLPVRVTEVPEDGNEEDDEDGVVEDDGVDA